MNIMIILNYNDYETSKIYLKMIDQYSSIDKIIIVDNCSTDSSFNKLMNLKSEKIDVISTNENKGYGSGNNYGILYAEEFYQPTNLIISNPDIMVSDKSIERICNYLDQHPEVAAASGLIHNANGTIASNFAWKLPSYLDIIFLSSIIANKCRKRIFRISTEYDISSVIKLEYYNVEVLSGCFFVIKDKVMREINYFDNETFLFGEEIILAHKLRETGQAQVVLTKEKIIHFQGISIKKAVVKLGKKLEIIKKSRLIYLKKYIKVSSLKILIFNIIYTVGKYEKITIQMVRNKVTR